VAQPPIFHLLAGPNGAGKTTLYKALVADSIIDTRCEFVNADHYERQQLQHIADAQTRSEAARHWADARRTSLLARGQAFVSETVFSHPSKIQLIAQAQQAGFVVALYVVCLDDPQRLLARVQRRVREGGHAVPPEKIIARYSRSLTNLQQAVQIADVAYLYDARDVEDSGPQLVAVCADGHAAQPLVANLPRWAQQVLAK
jgi:predicted ABC-type ATPase